MVQFSSTLTATAMLALVAVPARVTAMPTYPAKVPNGEKFGMVLGHNDPKSAAAFSNFAKAFRLNNHVWDKTLCEMTWEGSDMTNGQVLGDPCCTWSEAAPTEVQTVEVFDGEVPVTKTECASNAETEPPATEAPVTEAPVTEAPVTEAPVTPPTNCRIRYVRE